MECLYFNRVIYFTRLLILLLVFICSSNVDGSSKNPFITIIDSSTYSSLELETLNSFVDSSANITKYIVEIEDFRDYLVGSELTINIPNSVDSINFSTVNAVKDITGGTYWMGISSDGSIFRIGEYNEGTMINIYIEDQGSKYLCISISGKRYLMVEYDDWVGVENTYQCLNTDESPDDDEDEIISRSICDWNAVRVLVLVTPLANSLPFNSQVVAQNLINELNATTSASGLASHEISFILANTLVLTGFVESTNAKDDVSTLRNNQTAQDLRDDNLADIVILLTAPVYSGVAGIAHKIKAREQNAYCLATINATATGFTGSHEIGHIIGCRHQRLVVCDSNWDSWPVNAHGYKIGDDFRTIMHSVGCSRVRMGIWSNRVTTAMGVSNGNYFNNNVGRLRNRADKVACFRKGNPINPSAPTKAIHFIEGEIHICSSQFPPNYTVQFDTDQFTMPQYSWEISENGVTEWYIPAGLVSNGATCTLPFPASLPESFFLRVTITGANQNTESDMVYITVFDDPTGNCEITM